MNILPKLIDLAARGQYFRGVTPTPGTGVAMGIRTTFSETANGLMAIVNGEASKTTGKSTIIDYVRLICTAAGASTTASDLLICTDTIQRHAAGGTNLVFGRGVNTVFQADRTTNIAIGDVTFTAQSADRRYLSRLKLKTQAAPCWVVGDEIFIKFGSEAPSGSGLISGAAAARYCFDAGPVILGPGNSHSCTFHMWNTANATTPPSWEAEVGFVEF